MQHGRSFIEHVGDGMLAKLTGATKESGRRRLATLKPCDTWLLNAAYETIIDGVPTGLTQYNHLLHSPRLCANAERLATACCAYYHAAVWPRLDGTTFDRKTGSRFVVDFAVHPDALTGENPRIADEHIRLIELNCFYESTGMGMFDYQKDAKQLAEGPFECRVRTARLPHAAFHVYSSINNHGRRHRSVHTRSCTCTCTCTCVHTHTYTYTYTCA